MDPRLLPAFVALAEELHFGNAAKRTYLSQPTLSRQVSRLEGQLGVRLFERDTRHVTLTPAGEAMLEPARRALGALVAAERAAVLTTDDASEVLRLAVDVDVPQALIDRVRSVLESPPSVKPRLSFGHYVDVMQAILDGRTDAGLLWGCEPDERLSSWPVSSEEIVAVVRDDHPSAGRSSVRRDDLRDDVLVMFDRELGPPAFDGLVSLVVDGEARAPAIRHVEPAGAAHEAMFDGVRAGPGFTIAARSFFTQSPRERLVGVPFEPAGFAQILLVALRHERSPTVDALLRALDRGDAA